MSSHYKVKLTAKQRQDLLKLVRTGKDKAKKLTHARILLQADASSAGSGLSAKKIAEQLNIHARTALRVKRTFCQGRIKSGA